MAPSEVFAQCQFVILHDDHLLHSRAIEIQQTIEDSGGKAKVLAVGDKIDFDGDAITHIVSETSEFPQYSEADINRMLTVVTPAWISISLARSKLQAHRPYTPDRNKFLSNVVVSCADIPNGDKEAIIGAVLAFGGAETNSITRLTTHVCALTMEHPKIQAIMQKGLGKLKIVLPHWFDDCLKLGLRIDDAPYLLPDAEILRKNPEDDVPIPPADHMEGATASLPKELQIPVNGSGLYRSTVFANYTIMISHDLEINNRTRNVINGLIEGGGGAITTSVKDADIYVCHWRSGNDYTFASRAGKHVGNLSWLYHLITQNEWTSPYKKLLHYPLPKDPLPGFKDLRITLSNYAGDARVYLENLIQASGAEYTKNMKADNTHLITARNNSEKCDAAKEWGIEMVNHLWIEESYAKCEAQRLSDPRYTHFPPRTNLGEVIGQTNLNPKLLSQIFFPGGPIPDLKANPKKRLVMHEKDQNTEDALMSGAESDNPTSVTKPIKAISKAKTKSRASSGSVSTPIASRRTSYGKENDTPSSTRSAKDKAINNIHALAPDLALYEKEKHRKGPVWGGSRAANRIEKEQSLERSSSPAGENDDTIDERPKPKRAKQSKIPPAEIRLLLTAYKEWLDAPGKEEAEKKKLRELGILVVQDPTKCTHLAAPAMVRTKKFLCALASGPTIVSADFIGHCIGHGEVPDPEKFPLKDAENEKKFGVKLKDALIRAKANKRSLLRRVPVYCTPEVPMEDTYREIVESNGGTFFIYRARGGATIKPTTAEEDDGPAEPVYLLSGTRPEERKLWPKFIEMAKAGNMIPRIVKTEWLLDVAMSQQLKWNNSYLSSDSQ